MKRTSIVAILLILCLLMNLAACDTQGSNPTEPSQNTATSPTPAPTDPNGVEPTTPSPNVVYQAARESAQQLSNYILTFSYTLSYQVGNQHYTQGSTGTATVAGIHTENMQAFVQENIAYGTYESEYYRSYINGAGYCRVDNCNFTCPMTPEEFIADIPPIILLNESNYATVQAEIQDGSTIFSFSDATGFESWVDNGDLLALNTASGTATVNQDDELVASTYQADYTLDGIRYRLDVTVSIDRLTEPDFTGQPIYGDDCAKLNDLQIPRLLIQAVGSIFSTQDMTATYTDTLYSEAFSTIRSQSGSCDIFGSGEALSALVSSSVSVTDYTGTALSNSQMISFKDGVYSYSTNGGEPSVNDAITAEDVRIYCEDTILSALFTLQAIESAEMTVSDDFIYIKFTGNSQFSDSLCAGIYELFSFNLDTYSNSYETLENSGYLTLNRHTKQPTAAGMSLERVHNIGGVTYRLTYQLDQAMDLPSSNAGDTAPEEVPEETATPLLYLVTGENGEKMWLFGTIHVGDARTNYLPETIMDAFKSADALAVEFDVIAFNDQLLTNAGLQQDVSNAYYYTDGSTFYDHLSDAMAHQVEMIIKASGQYNINTPYIRVSILSSMIENFYLDQHSSLQANKAMENRLLTWAKEQNKTIYEVETGLKQLKVLSGFSEELQNLMLQQLLEQGMVGYCQDEQRLYELWCAGDALALTAYLATDTSNMTEEELTLWKEYNKAMYTNRNKNMAKIAKQYLQSDETVFYAVGTAHLLGEDGLIQRLQDAGYTVEQVAYE